MFLLTDGRPWYEQIYSGVCKAADMSIVIFITVLILTLMGVLDEYEGGVYFIIAGGISLGITVAALMIGLFIEAIKYYF